MGPAATVHTHTGSPPGRMGWGGSMFNSQACSQHSVPGTEQGCSWYWSASSEMETSPSLSHSGAGPDRSAGLSETPQLRVVLGCSLHCCAHGRSSSSPATALPEGGRRAGPGWHGDTKAQAPGHDLKRLLRARIHRREDSERGHDRNTCISPGSENSPSSPCTPPRLEKNVTENSGDNPCTHTQLCGIT